MERRSAATHDRGKRVSLKRLRLRHCRAVLLELPVPLQQSALFLGRCWRGDEATPVGRLRVDRAGWLDLVSEAVHDYWAVTSSNQRL